MNGWLGYLSIFTSLISYCATHMYMYVHVFTSVYIIYANIGMYITYTVFNIHVPECFIIVVVSWTDTGNHHCLGVATQ